MAFLHKYKVSHQIIIIPEDMKKEIFKLFTFSKKNSQRSKDLLLYLIFLLISFIFWLLLTLNNSVQKDFIIDINVKSVPDSTTLINVVPSQIRASIKDKGSSLLKYTLGRHPVTSINFQDYSGNGIFRVSSVELKSIIREIFGSNATIYSISPDSLYSKYTNIPGKSVPVKISCDVKTNYQYVIGGEIKSIPDSVKVYSDRSTLAMINAVNTINFSETDLKDTLIHETKIHAIKDVRIIPDKVKVVVPVEQLITKNRTIPILVKNVPENINFITFPSKVTASYLVPLSKYNNNDYIYAEADYKDLLQKKRSKLHIKISSLPEIYKNVSLSIDSVEYIIEKK